MIQFLLGFVVSGLIFVISFIYFVKNSSSSTLTSVDTDKVSVKEGFKSGEDVAVKKCSLSATTAEQRPKLRSVDSQANFSSTDALWLTSLNESHSKTRELGALLELLKAQPEDAYRQMSDEELCLLMKDGALKPHLLEKELGNETKAVHVRRKWISSVANLNQKLSGIPYLNYDYSFVSNTCCENVLGYVPLPVGYAGPLKINGRGPFYIPMATTEGCLVASTNRGCRALQMAADGVRCGVKDVGMTRGPVVMFNRAEEALKAKCWFEKSDHHNFRFIKQKFDSTSRFLSLKEVKCNVAGRLLFMRFLATTGDAMGMNMVSKATDAALRYLKEQCFPNMRIISLSGNFCVDKKPAAVNWIEGRGKTVVCDAILPGRIVREVLKSSPGAMEELNRSKNLIGSAVAGCLGGFNAHAANIVTAVFLATGQDAAQAVTSSSCLTVVERQGTDDLYISVTLPCLEVGTVGGGTMLPPQRACLEVLGCSGGASQPGRTPPSSPE